MNYNKCNNLRYLKKLRGRGFVGPCSLRTWFPDRDWTLSPVDTPSSNYLAVKEFPQENYAELSSQLKRLHTVYSINLTFLKRQNNGAGEHQWLPVVKERGRAVTVLYKGQHEGSLYSVLYWNQSVPTLVVVVMNLD